MKQPPLPPRKDIPSFWRPHAPESVFLHLGENPLPPTSGVMQAMNEALRNANRYPDTNALALRSALAEYCGAGLSPENILVGNGSDELIDLAVLSLTEREQPVYTYEPSFFVYRFSAARHGRPVVQIPRQPDYAIPAADAVKSQWRPETGGLHFIANPNNPTGTLSSIPSLEAILESAPGYVVIDECYYEFCYETLAERIHNEPGLLILRSLSKSFGLSGLRLGYALGHPETIDRLARTALTFPVNAIAQAAGLAVLQEQATYQKRIRQLIDARERLTVSLQNLGCEVLPSAANFVLAFWPQPVESQPVKRLAEMGVWVSDQTAALQTKRPALRIAVGTPDEIERLLEAMHILLNE